jgi:hypothetical protein
VGLERVVMVLVGEAEKDEFLINGAPQKHNALWCIGKAKGLMEKISRSREIVSYFV